MGYTLHLNCLTYLNQSHREYGLNTDLHMYQALSDSLLQHVKRVNYQTCVWRPALIAMQHLPEPEIKKWTRDGTSLKPAYRTKDPAPCSILQLITSSCNGGCERNCSWKNTGLSCTKSCFCMADVDVCKTHMVLFQTLAAILRAPNQSNSGQQFTVTGWSHICGKLTIVLVEDCCR